MFQRYPIVRWDRHDYTSITLQAVSEERQRGSMPHVDAGPSQAVVQTSILISSEASAEVRTF